MAQVIDVAKPFLEKFGQGNTSEVKMFHVKPAKQMKVEELGLTLTSKDLEGIETPHDNPLVITTLVGNHNIH